MNKKVAIIIAPNWKDYAERYLQECVDSIRKLDWPEGYKIFITDNETSPESFQYISKVLPEAEIILNNTNDGFAKGNNDSMRLALSQGYDYLFLVNMDAVVDKNCLKELVNAVEQEDNIGIAQARIMLYDNKEKINSLGNISHFLGFGYALNYQEDWESIKKNYLTIKDIMYPSGAGLLIKREVLEKIGLFDEELWMYNEDQDLGWRTWLVGYRCVLAPKAVVYHKYEFAKSIKQYYWMDRNRIIVMLKNYKFLTLLIIFPAFLAMELGLILFSLKSGWFKGKCEVWKYFLKLKTWGYILNDRREIQGLRKTKDSDIIDKFSGRIWYQEIDDWKLRIINPIFNLYWKICKFIIIW